MGVNCHSINMDHLEVPLFVEIQVHIDIFLNILIIKNSDLQEKVVLANYCNIYLLGEEGSRIIHYSDLQEKVVLAN